MNVQDLNKRKEVLESNLKQVNERITSDTQQAFRIQGAIVDIKEIIAEDEKKAKEEKEKKEKNKGKQ